MIVDLRLHDNKQVRNELRGENPILSPLCPSKTPRELFRN